MVLKSSIYGFYCSILSSALFYAANAHAQWNVVSSPTFSNTGAGSAGGAAANAASCSEGVSLLVSLPCGANGTQCIPPGALPLDIVRTYFDCLYPFVLGTAAGITVLWTIIAGAAMILYAGEEQEATKYKEHFKQSLIGLFIVLFAATILNFINPVLFQ